MLGERILGKNILGEESWGTRPGNWEESWVKESNKGRNLGDRNTLGGNNLRASDLD